MKLTTIKASSFLKKKPKGIDNISRFHSITRDYLRGRLIIGEERIEGPKGKKVTVNDQQRYPSIVGRSTFLQSIPKEYNKYWVGLAWALYDKEPRKLDGKTNKGGRKEIFDVRNQFDLSKNRGVNRSEDLILNKVEARVLFELLRDDWERYVEKCTPMAKKKPQDKTHLETPNNFGSRLAKQIDKHVLSLESGNDIHLHPPRVNVVSISRPLIEDGKEPTAHNFSVGIFAVQRNPTKMGSYRELDWKAFTLTQNAQSSWTFNKFPKNDTYEWGDRGKVKMYNFMFTYDEIFTHYSSRDRINGTITPGRAFLKQVKDGLYKGQYFNEIRGPKHATQQKAQRFGGDVLFVLVNDKTYEKLVTSNSKAQFPHFEAFIQSELSKEIRLHGWHRHDYSWP